MTTNERPEWKECAKFLKQMGITRADVQSYCRAGSTAISSWLLGYRNPSKKCAYRLYDAVKKAYDDGRFPLPENLVPDEAIYQRRVILREYMGEPLEPLAPAVIPPNPYDD